MSESGIGIDTLPSSSDPAALLDWTSQEQSRASHPGQSAWVSANAGSGKTHVLTQRVIRLLLAGARPSSILCLTYTKAAASEMSNRVFQRLAEWATLDDAELSQRIAKIEQRQPDRVTLAAARRLFAKALETPGGLKIQTIHAFCEALLHQFPLEANVAGHFNVLDDRAAVTVLAEARRSLLTATSTENDPALAEAFSKVLSIADESGLETLIGDIVANRHAIRDFRGVAERLGGLDLALRRRFGIGPTETELSRADDYWPLDGLSGPSFAHYIRLALEKGGEKVRAVAETLERALVETDPLVRVSLIDSAFLTSSETAKADSSLIAAAMTKAAPELKDAVIAAREHIMARRDRLRIFRMYEATKAAFTLALRLDTDYEELKKRRSQLDFEDLIVRTAQLLTRSDVGAWVHYKLDQGIDHILVDEAQDTSPVQWAVIRSLREDFFSGASAKAGIRTFFAVGDEKQSIYSFQGARPEQFSAEAKQTQAAVSHSGQAFNSVRLPLSFRSTESVLQAVDQVFLAPENRRGLSAGGDDIVHRSSRIGQPGVVDVWEMIVADKQEKTEDWTAPFDATPESAPSALLARRIAYQIREMVGRETIIEDGHVRLIRPGDILVLVRKRDSFVNSLTRALKRPYNIPVAGADRLKLTSHIAVQDMLALGRFLLLPNDDLSLAALLKGPLFNHAEDDLLTLASERPEGQSLWRRLQHEAEPEGSPWRRTFETLTLFFEQSRVFSVHDFFARVLGAHHGRKAYLARLGSEVSDILDEFLSFALAFETAGLPGLQSFISTLEMEAPEVKREQDKERNEVRIMTVHASKGLEAPIVFLVDGGSKPFNSNHLAKFRLLEAEDGVATPFWVPGKSLSNSLTQRDSDRLQALAEEEYRRLLYVAMTRAADRLIIAGYRGVNDPGDIWHRMVFDALRADDTRCAPAEYHGPDGTWNGVRWSMPDRDREFPQAPESSEEQHTIELPKHLWRPLAPPIALPRPLSPSTAGSILIDDDSEDMITASALFVSDEKPDIALQRGRLIHRMLQNLPEVPRTEWADAAERYVNRSARFWPMPERQRLVSTVLSVLENPELTSLFTDGSQPEVSVMGTLMLRGEPRAVSGRLDRMAVLPDKVVIADYKTNRKPPRNADSAPLSHRAQLAIYREILKPLYPGKSIECWLVYTETGSLIRLDDTVLARSLADLQTS
ncbi:ATP-dependent DNA helicase [Rhizobium sp. Root274]|uniref:double-strand break repair helicase AddA n=1 Tax=unclassified Rhizobium TaxID=2613769 RepID=UPI0007136ED4|nr:MULTISPECIES: double-strand break repair helicase AddA [unclassified Rhizobium]KQW27808.1 ATP-dependent DNA helicase [Rhizobium sp. Root1240]KRD28089.1 ATP-dependent DNA helicase [Rhizobium sp. Root274]